MEYLIDTDWAIDYLNGIQETVQRVQDLIPVGVGISIISLAEILDGLYGSRNLDEERQSLDALLGFLDLVNVNQEICHIFARERRRLRSIGFLVADFDLLVGATAIHHNLTLLTNNRRHFERIQGLSVISP